MKVLGLLLISVLPVLWGVEMKNKVKKRLTVMETFLKFIIFVREQIRFSAREVDEIFILAKGEKNFPALGEVINEFIKNKNISATPKMGLNKNEADLITGFINGLGKNDIEGQLVHCDYYREKANSQIERTFKDFRQKGRLYISLSLAAGAVLFIMFI